jgi:uncharacterized protein (TIGR02246 family)
MLLVITFGFTMDTDLTAHADEAADREALQSLVREYEAAVKKGDPTVLKPFLASDFTGVMVTGEPVAGYESIETYWNKIQRLLGEGGKYSVKINIAGPATIAGNIAYAHGTSEDTAITSAGKEYKFQGFWTAVCVRQDDRWKIARIHGSMDAITNTFIRPMLRASAITGGLIGGAVGFALSAILFWMLGRRKRSKIGA